MLKCVNHIAIATPDLDSAIATYRNQFQAEVSDPVIQAEHGVRIAFVSLNNTKIELMESYGENSPIQKFLDKNPSGGVHHICYGVDNIQKASETLLGQGTHLLGNGEAKIGAHGKPVIFLHPKSCNGVLIELEEL